jgi:hypothetical protein
VFFNAPIHIAKRKAERLAIKWARSQKELLAPLGKTGAQTLHVFVAKMFAELSMKCALFAIRHCQRRLLLPTELAQQ